MMSEEREENKYINTISKCHEVVSAISRKVSFISTGAKLSGESVATTKAPVVLERELEELLAHLQTVHDGIQV